jgi:hypothetical protein
VLTSEEQKELDGLKSELVAVAIIVVGADKGKNGSAEKARGEVGKMLRGNGGSVDHTDNDVYQWIIAFCTMYGHRINWAEYLKKKCTSNETPLDDNDAFDKFNADRNNNGDVDKYEIEARKWLDGNIGKRRYVPREWNRAKPLIETAENDWKNLVIAENKYRDALRKYGQV